MSLMINDRRMADDLIAARRASGADRYDEVWEGVYMMSPMANNEHQALATALVIALGTVIDWKGLGRTLAGANVSDRQENWTHNYRVPDVLVFLNDSSAVDCGTHWFGGPDFVVEIVSPGDRTLEKLDFYAAVGTRELLVVDRDPWQLTLYRATETPLPRGAGQEVASGAAVRPNVPFRERRLIPSAVSSFTQFSPIVSSTLPVQLSLDAEASCIRIEHQQGDLIQAIPIEQRPGEPRR